MAGAGELRERVRIQSEVRTKDPGRGAVVTWVDADRFPEVSAKITGITGREQVIAAQLQAIVTHMVKIRWRADIHEGMRLLWRGRAMNIRAVLPDDGKRLYLFMICELGAPT